MRFPDDVPVLTCGDVTLRAHRLDDADAIVEQCTDPVSITYTTVPLGYDHAMALDWVTTSVPAGWESGRERLFAIETTHPDGVRRFSGSLSLRDEGDQRAELAFGAHPAVRGRGVMTTAVGLILDYGFDALGLQTVIWLANRGNVGSRRVAWKTGFTFAGTLRHWLNHRGEYCDAWSGTLHRDDTREPKGPWYDLAVIEGDRVRLRPLVNSDVERIVEGCSDERTQYWLAILPSPYQVSDAQEFVARTQEQAVSGLLWTWAVADRDSDALVGVLGLPRGGRYDSEVGYWTHPDARGQGLTSEAVALLVRHAFMDGDDGGLGRSRLYLKAAADNAASQRVAVRNGFQQCGRERSAELLRDGTWSDLVVFDLLRDEWVERQG